MRGLMRSLGLAREADVSSDAETLRERILRTVLVGLAGLGIIAYVPSLVLSLEVGYLHVAIVDTVGLVWVIALALSRDLSTRARTLQLLAGVYLLGAFLTAALGPVGAGPLWLLGFSVLAALLLGMSGAVASLGLNLATLAAITLLDATLRPAWLAVEGERIPVLFWLVIDANFALLNAGLAISIAVMLEGLEREIGRRQHAEAERRRLAQVVEQSLDWVVITSLEGELRYVNAAFTQATRLDDATVRGSMLVDTGVLGGDTEQHAELWDTLASGSPWNGRVTIQLEGGSEHQLEVTFTPLRDAAGTVTHYVGVLRDVTDVRALERQLRRAQTLEAVGTLAGGIAHDFNNTLVPMMTYAEMVRDHLPEDSAEREDLDEVVRAGERASSLVRRILTFSRQVHTARRPLTLQPLLKESVKLLRASLPSTIELRLDVEASEQLVHADPVEVQQLIFNLCTNAFHAMRERGGVLTLGLRSLDASALAPDLTPDAAPRYVELSVTDTGCGIAADDRTHIFDPFFTTKAPGEGTGLGLATVRATVTALGGAIAVDSTEGEGSRFTIVLPVARDKAEAVVSHASVVLEGRGRQVLVVDDEPAIVQSCSRLLRRWGFEVVTAANAVEALALLDGGVAKPDALLTDLTMPKMTGAQLAERVRASHVGLPIVIMTGVLDSQAQHQLAALGIDGLLPKPFNFKQLASVLGEALGEATR